MNWTEVYFQFLTNSCTRIILIHKIYEKLSSGQQKKEIEG